MYPANVEIVIAEGRLSDVAGLLDAAALQVVYVGRGVDVIFCCREVFL